MTLPTGLFSFRKRYYAVATTSSSGAPTSTVVIVNRCKYLGGYYVPNQVTGTGTTATGFDVQYITGATSTVASTITDISSGVAVTTSTGTLGIPFGPVIGTGNSTRAFFLNPGDVLLTVASTGVGGFITHVVEEF